MKVKDLLKQKVPGSRITGWKFFYRDDEDYYIFVYHRYLKVQIHISEFVNEFTMFYWYDLDLVHNHYKFKECVNKSFFIAEPVSDADHYFDEI